MLGDTPYSEDQVRKLDALIEDLNRQRLAFVVHVGDLGTSAQACRDDWLAARKAQLGRIRHPLVVIPGDNEWSDCKEPLPRLAAWRAMFCWRNEPKVERQAGEYCEHLRWRHGDTLFVTLNIPGNNNNARMPAERAARMKAVLAWIDEAEKLAPKRLVLLTQANPFVPRLGYEAFRNRLERLARARPGRVVLVHGDTHLYRDDEPYPGLRRLEVWGAPFVSWARGLLEPGGVRFEGAPLY
ncbi:MAG TPA: hypothetical protein VEB41_03540 [Burkholderiales bacterium]|nr:hypothetical protein [Burkholderiales bacterium]